MPIKRTERRQSVYVSFNGGGAPSGVMADIAFVEYDTDTDTVISHGVVQRPITLAQAKSWLGDSLGAALVKIQELEDKVLQLEDALEQCQLNSGNNP